MSQTLRIYLVRHGQASFGQPNYDVLSELGWRQARRLGRFWRSNQGGRRHGRKPDFTAVFSGTLNRQVQTWHGIADGAGLSRAHFIQREALNEYHVPAVIKAIHPRPLEKSRDPATYAARLQVLRQALISWMHGNVQPEGLPSYVGFQRRVLAVLDEIRARYCGDVLVVSSAGPIAAVLSHLLRASPEATTELNLAYRNSAVTELVNFEGRLRLMDSNALPHLQHAKYRDWISWI